MLRSRSRGRRGAGMTAVVQNRDARVRMLTKKQARAELESLLSKAGMSREELEQRGNAWDLDADQRGILADIRGLEFLIERATKR